MADVGVIRHFVEVFELNIYLEVVLFCGLYWEYNNILLNVFPPERRVVSSESFEDNIDQK